MNFSRLPASWAEALGDEISKPYVRDLCRFIDGERSAGEVFPPDDQVLCALAMTPLHRVRVLILGQDPYHGPGQAHGLAFSVPDGVAPPPSLKNIFKELSADLGAPIPQSGSLRCWAEQGVLLLNTVLTVRAGAANSHKDRGWEQFTDAIIGAVSAQRRPAVFVLWGDKARKKARLIDSRRHRVLEGAHPSPLSAHQGFFGSRPFSKVNELLASLGQPPIDWDLSGAAQMEASP